MARSFTWFEKFGEVLEALPDENQAEFALAIVRYGSLGEEPEFDSPLMAALFTAIREDVDNSLTKRRNRRSKPTAAQMPKLVSINRKPRRNQNLKLVSMFRKPTRNQFRKVVSNNRKPVLI